MKLDEFGRDINLQKQMDMEKRAQARQRRKTRFDSKRLSCMEVDSSDEKIKGELSTDESESESDSEKNDVYQSTRDLLLRTAEEIFSDASSNIPNFQWWKKDLKLLAGKICVLAGEICVDYGIVGKSFCFLVTDYYHTKNRSLGRLG